MDELPLCAAEMLQDKGRAFTFDVLQFGRPVPAFALRFEGQVVAYLNRCAHVPVQMDGQPSEFLDLNKRFILCSIHGAAYEPKDGRCVGGPCGKGRLRALTVQERDGQVYWYPDRDVQPNPVPAPGQALPAGTPK